MIPTVAVFFAAVISPPDTPAQYQLPAEPITLSVDFDLQVSRRPVPIVPRFVWSRSTVSPVVAELLTTPIGAVTRSIPRRTYEFFQVDKTLLAYVIWHNQLVAEHRELVMKEWDRRFAEYDRRAAESYRIIREAGQKRREEEAKKRSPGG